MLTGIERFLEVKTTVLHIYINTGGLFTVLFKLLINGISIIENKCWTLKELKFKIELPNAYIFFFSKLTFNLISDFLKKIIWGYIVFDNINVM